MLTNIVPINFSNKNNYRKLYYLDEKLLKCKKTDYILCLEQSVIILCAKDN